MREKREQAPAVQKRPRRLSAGAASSIGCNGTFTSNLSLAGRACGMVLRPSGVSNYATGRGKGALVRLGVKLAVAAATLAVGTFAIDAQEEHVRWTRNGAPTETTITGGGWTLEQSGAGVRLKSSGYCDGSGNQIGNPGTERMQPYYFPVVAGRGRHLQGYFDYRPKDIDEAVAAAFSDDAGQSWTFQQKVLELRTTCPNQVQKDPDGDKDNNPPTPTTATMETMTGKATSS